ncbi:hypothetical protein M409DRAFT_61090 [Zasmidium cellare ATCC 36951]|uniref:Uncharacterized protein n=1 Tax=Zasmidium cellare ATCC 36951 TaxID=1080233 RepID=A0A6A6BYK7_ZASCE|nr:uncharacterized protein M409DRAFT_61090 [Zasmidium cellare ATCC 36951]KAF2159138.1 hypothetical protein M409DRAFT_61090 [Zasmidium cellare ATCC 36951]
MASLSTAANVTHKNFVWMADVTSPKVDDVSQICFSFNTYGGLPGFFYLLSGVWAPTDGSAPNGYRGTSGTICVPTTAPGGAGGAMYISAGDTGPGNTKLECYFPSAGTANCDISLVDGYSNSVGCVPSNDYQLIGEYEDLYGNGINCPDQQGVNCINQEGPYATSQDQIDAFFQQGTYNDNNYCIFPDCGQDYYFATGAGLICSVGV